MAVYGFYNAFTVGPGSSILITAWINGESESGGEFHGPAVAAALATQLHQRLATSTVDVEFTARNDDGLSSKCFYHYTVTNNNSFPVSFVRNLFMDN
jgi:hypothetical protein